MEKNEVNRKIAVIFATDVVGYSTAMEENEVQTLNNLRACRKILEDLFQQHGGRVFNTAGDSILAEFSSAVSAVVCAVEFQNLIQARNKTSNPKQRMEFRIGINMGDVVIEEGNLYGEGVNIAARLEALAKPNGICLSKNVHELVNSKTQFFFNDLGEQKVKNTLLHAFDLSINPSGKRPEKYRKTKDSKLLTRIMVSTTAVLTLFFAGLIFYNYFYGKKKNENIIIAVMPFLDGLSDQQKTYFIDGITEDLIIDLSKIENLSLISQNSVFQFKDKVYKDLEVAELFGADYILKGKVRDKLDILRINVELIDGDSGNIHWAEIFEKPEDKLFEIEDEIVFGIAEKLALSLPAEAKRKIETASTANLEAYELYRRGLSVNDREEAREFYKKAIELDPEFSRAYASLAISLALQMVSAEVATMSDVESKLMKDEALKYAEIAQTLSPDESIGYFAAALVYSSAKLPKKSEAAVLNALEIEPQNILALTLSANLKIDSGLFEDGLRDLQIVRKLDPLFPIQLFQVEGRAFIGLSRFEETFAVSENALERNPAGVNPMLNFITAAWRLGKKDEALWQLEELQIIKNEQPLANSIENLEAYLHKQPWDQNVKNIIQTTFSEILENR